MLCNCFTFSIIQVLQLTIIWRGVLLDDLMIVFQEEHLGSSQWFFGFLSLLALVSRYPTVPYFFNFVFNVYNISNEAIVNGITLPKQSFSALFNTISNEIFELFSASRRWWSRRCFTTRRSWGPNVRQSSSLPSASPSSRFSIGSSWPPFYSQSRPSGFWGSAFLSTSSTSQSIKPQVTHVMQNILNNLSQFISLVSFLSWF